MITKIYNFVKTKLNDIILGTVIGLLILLSFAIGFIVAKHQQKQPIQIKETGAYLDKIHRDNYQNSSQISL